MFDAKSILEGLVRGAAPNQGQPGQSGGGLADILGEILGGGAGQQPAGRSGGAATPGQSGGFGDILAEIQRQLGQSGGQSGSSTSPRSGGGSVPPTGDTGGLGDLLNQIKDKIGQPGAGGSSGGGIMDVLGQVLAQATQGAKEGAAKIGEATGAKDALGRATGQSPDDLLARLKDLIQQNPLAAGTAAGGLGGLVLGTRTGRALAGGAARIGALALIGGLAYKAYQNYQTGKPLISGATPAEAAPQGSGFEPAAVTDESAALYIRAMIAAASADGRVDEGEQSRIIDSLKQAGVDAEAEEFLANELNRPATIQELASAIQSPQEAMQVYTAARIAIEPDDRGEQRFLQQLAEALNIDAKLAAHIDATARGAAV
ncbi:MAG: tellurite resistance TerB family protein [Hyphomicrobium sp.]